jgi:hypothetical protein
MKKSNRVLIVLATVLLMGIVATDYLLAVNYTKIDLQDPYKNFENIVVKPFNNLRIKGGNGYSIQILRGEQFGIRLLSSRKSFFKMQQSGDTVSLTFSVAGRNPQQSFDATRGIIITAPAISSIDLEGVNTDIEAFQQDSMLITQGTNTATRLSGLKIQQLRLKASGLGVIDCKAGNYAAHLDLHFRNSTTLLMNGIRFRNIQPQLEDSAVLVLSKANMPHFMLSDSSATH